MVNHHMCRYAGCAHPHEKLIKPSDVAVRYGKRHYMHADCYVLSGKPFSKLGKHQAEQLPYFLLKDTGRLAELEAYLNPHDQGDAK